MFKLFGNSAKHQSTMLHRCYNFLLNNATATRNACYIALALLNKKLSTRINVMNGVITNWCLPENEHAAPSQEHIHSNRLKHPLP